METREDKEPYPKKVCSPILTTSIQVRISISSYIISDSSGNCVRINNWFVVDLAEIIREVETSRYSTNLYKI